MNFYFYSCEYTNFKINYKFDKITTGIYYVFKCSILLASILYCIRYCRITLQKKNITSPSGVVLPVLWVVFSVLGVVFPVFGVVFPDLRCCCISPGLGTVPVFMCKRIQSIFLLKVKEVELWVCHNSLFEWQALLSRLQNLIIIELRTVWAQTLN